MSKGNLRVYLYETHIGDLVATGTGGVSLHWSKAAEDRWLINSPVLSQSLRVGRSTPAQTASFFGALLPEGANLDRLANEIHVPSNDLVGIFNRVGADLAGRCGSGTLARPRTHRRLTMDKLMHFWPAHRGFWLVAAGLRCRDFNAN